MAGQTVYPKRLMLLGSGELGKEVVLAAQRLGQHVIAADSYDNAPAMQVADERVVVSMLDADALRAAIAKAKPDVLIPEVEAIATHVLAEFEAQGVRVSPTAKAAQITMNREMIRELAAKELGLRTAPYAYATTAEELRAAADKLGYPCVVKPIMSSSGKGQSVVRSALEVQGAWDYAMAGARAKNQVRVIVEGFIQFELEITLLTVRTRDGKVHFCDPIGHRQERGDYMESWMPAAMPPDVLKAAQDMADRVTAALCQGDNGPGAGLFGVEFFLASDGVVFSEVSPRPHDTGLVTLISQSMSEFELHLRAVLDLPIPDVRTYGPAASAVILADRAVEAPRYSGLSDALAEPGTDLRIFGKPRAHLHRRMGVALALAESTDAARAKAKRAADCVAMEG
jgi:phosphoribosylglycinamide formyltransferase 2